MRADRLVAILLMLQARGRVTAAEVAAELEISERTARRDLDALGISGLPVYSQQGRNGGWALAGGGRTDLSGLSAAEARALFLVAGPSSSATPELRAALRKLVRALPPSFRTHAEAAAAAIVVDPSGWDERTDARGAPPFIAATTRTVHPYGLAAKGAVWYLVAGTDRGLRTFRVDRIRGWRVTGDPVERPAGFDLRAAWQMVVDEVEARRAPLRAHIEAEPDVVPVLRTIFGTRVQIGPANARGTVTVEVRGHHLRSLAGQLAGLGARIEVIAPAALRDEMATVARELAGVYLRTEKVVRRRTRAR